MPVIFPVIVLVNALSTAATRGYKRTPTISFLCLGEAAAASMSTVRGSRFWTIMEAGGAAMQSQAAMVMVMFLARASVGSLEFDQQLERDPERECEANSSLSAHAFHRERRLLGSPKYLGCRQLCPPPLLMAPSFQEQSRCVVRIHERDRLPFASRSPCTVAWNPGLRDLSVSLPSSLRLSSRSTRIETRTTTHRHHASLRSRWSCLSLRSARAVPGYPLPERDASRRHCILPGARPAGGKCHRISCATRTSAPTASALGTRTAACVPYSRRRFDLAHLSRFLTPPPNHYVPHREARAHASRWPLGVPFPRWRNLQTRTASAWRLVEEYNPLKMIEIIPCFT